MTRLLNITVVIAILALGPAGAVRGQLPLILTESDEQEWLEACGSLNGIALPELAQISAQWRPAMLSGLRVASDAGDADRPAHCRVSGRIESAIRFELRLPAPDAWNGRFLAIGSDDAGGRIDTERLELLLAAGYASAMTDNGHAESGYAWLGDPGLLRDYAYRAVYEMTAKSNVIVSAFYGRPADFRYFNGCSDGGRQGLMEAQRFAADYDGIVAGAPVSDFIATQSTELWGARTSRPATRSPSRLSAEALARLRTTALAQCDTLDGVADGILEDPRRCNFDPARVQCGAGTGNQCLSPAAVTAAREIYRGPINPESGGLITPGLAIGSESSWRFASDQGPSAFAVDFFRHAVFGNQSWDWQNFDLAADHALALEEVGWLLDASAPDLSDFRDRGGKLLLYHGWNDTLSSPEGTIRYFEAVETTLAGHSNPLAIGTSDFARLFMVPGMAECSAGDVDFDAQRAVEDWVERGIAPDRIEAAYVEGETAIRTRPLCPYPQTARYRGAGNTDRSGSFTCGP